MFQCWFSITAHCIHVIALQFTYVRPLSFCKNGVKVRVRIRVSLGVSSLYKYGPIIYR